MIPWRLILFLCILTLVMFFIGFNITNVSDISFGFYTFTEVPVFISLFIAFLFGVSIMLPFTFLRKKGKPGRIPVKDGQSALPETDGVVSGTVKTSKKGKRKKKAANSAAPEKNDTPPAGPDRT